MTNLSLLSRTALCLAAGGAIVVGDAVLALALDGHGWVGVLIGRFLALAAFCGAAFYLARAAQTIGRAADVCVSAARGDLEARIFEAPEPGVIGLLQRNINNVLDITDAFVREASGATRYISHGKYFRKVLLRGLPGSFQGAARDLNEAAEVMAAKVQEFAGIADDFEKSVGLVVESVSSAATELHASAEAMSHMASSTNERATSVAAATEQASSNVQTVAAAAEELSASVSEIGRQVARSSQIAQQAAADAERTNLTVEGLTEVARQVGEVVQLINDIASQTNLLALNATIEAARAGEAGKGFAVVANEVKSLANQTAKATEEITAQIAAMRSATGDAVGAIKAIGETIREMNGIAAAIASAVEEQGAATQEIARNIQEAAASAGEMASNIGGVTQAASETGVAAGQVLGTAGELATQSERLRTEVDRFLRSARVA